MKGIILAAGRGSRLRPITDYTHKALLKIDGESILSWQIRHLNEYEMSEVIVITGYKSEQIELHINNINITNDLDLTVIRNKKWDVTENAYSLSLADDYIEDEQLVVMNCDIRPESDLFEQVLHNPTTSTVPYDPVNNEEDALQLKLNDGQPAKILDKGHSEGDGATLGFFQLNSTATKALFEDIRTNMNQSGIRSRWFEHSISRLFNRFEFSAVNVSDYSWFEVDTTEDYINSLMAFGFSQSDIEKRVNSIIDNSSVQFHMPRTDYHTYE